MDAITMLHRQPCRLRLLDLKAARLPRQAKLKRGTQFCDWATDRVEGAFDRPGARIGHRRPRGRIPCRRHPTENRIQSNRFYVRPLCYCSLSMLIVALSPVASVSAKPPTTTCKVSA